MRFLSVCSGIEATTVAWSTLGWNAVGFCENAAFPSALLRYHYPTIINFYDITTIEGHHAYEATHFDILVGGTPCQSFSVAGLRKGLDDERGKLIFAYCRILAQKRPKWLVWENVFGVLSSNHGRDFGTFLGALAELGYGFAYRVLDAQYFGVPQRRRRVFIVGHIGDWRSAAAVLFERSSLQVNAYPFKTKRARTAKPTPTSTLTAFRKIKHAKYVESKVLSTVKARDRKHDGDLICIQGNMIRPYGGCNGKGWSTDEISYTLTTGDRHLVAFKKTNLQVRRLLPIECERLQGFPDNYTRIPWRGKPIKECPDGHRFEALGNSMAVPVMRWIGKRIAAVEGLKRTANSAA